MIVMVSIKAHFDGQTIVPDEPVDLRKDEKLVVHIQPVEKNELKAEPVTGCGSVWDKLLSLAGKAEHLPADAADQHDHYLYGTPKR
jgi:hypothetical protein